MQTNKSTYTSCPHLIRHSDCALKQVEHLLFQEKVKWIENLSEEQKKAILEFHLVCSKNR